MTNSSVHPALSPRAWSVAALLMVSVFSQRADAMSPINPGGAPAKSAASGLTIEVRGSHGGGGGGGRSAGGWSGGHSFSAGPVGSSFVRGGAIGVGAATVVAPGAVAGAPRYGGHGFVHRRHFGRVFVGGVYYDDYPYDDSTYYDDPAYPVVYPAPAFVAGGGCYRVLTVHGPRVVCHHRVKRHYHRTHRRLHHRRHHHA